MGKVTDNEKEVILSLDGGNSVTVLKYGATILSWKVNGKEQLWLSEKAITDGSKAVRGGIPLVFPVFGPPPSNHATDGLPQHGFSRNHNWELLGQTTESPLTVQFGLGPEQLSEAARTIWNYDFTLIYSVTLTKDSLVTALSVENNDTKPFEFNVLFHTYLRIPNISDITVSGLNELPVIDKVSKTNYIESSSAVSIDQEVDRVYQNSSNPVCVLSNGKTIFTIQNRKNVADVVVWNPWIEKSQGLNDFYPKDGFKQMICIETGSVAKFITLEPSKKWEGSQTIKCNL